MKIDLKVGIDLLPVDKVKVVMMLTNYCKQELQYRPLEDESSRKMLVFCHCFN